MDFMDIILILHMAQIHLRFEGTVLICFQYVVANFETVVELFCGLNHGYQKLMLDKWGSAIAGHTLRIIEREVGLKYCSSASIWKTLSASEALKYANPRSLLATSWPVWLPWCTGIPAHGSDMYGRYNGQDYFMPCLIFFSALIKQLLSVHGLTLPGALVVSRAFITWSGRGTNRPPTYLISTCVRIPLRYIL